jgi:D-sedoheptulose 7-phosphate isomerase
MNATVTTASAHVIELRRALDDLERSFPVIERLGTELGRVLLAGGRLLVAGNGGSAAQAQHLTAELVGRYQGERQPLSAIPLGADVAALTAIVNDYPATDLFARQARAHGRPGDVLLALSTSGRSTNLLAAVGAATEAGLRTWAFTGAVPNPLADVVDEAVVVSTPSTAIVQEVHQVVIHLLCEAVDAEVMS